MFTQNKRVIYIIFTLFLLTRLQVPIYGYTTSYEDIPSISISGESAILMDAKNGEILYGKNINARQYPASITKLMTALLAIENQKPTDMVTMSKEAVFSIERGSSHIGLDVDEQITLDQALHALLLQSANESANGIAELCDGSISAFAEHMTARAKELGTKDTSFKNPHGLHDPEHYTTAYDMALITQAINKEPYFHEIMQQITYQIPPTNKTAETRYLAQQHPLLNEKRDSRMYRKDATGGKTGYTDQAKHTLVTIAKQGDMELICVILKSDKSQLYSDTNKLLDYGFENYKSISFHKKEQLIDTIPMYTIKSGQLIHMSDCNISVKDDINLLVSKDVKERKIDTVISLPDHISQKFSQGDVVGTITYTYNGQSLATNDLVIQSFNYMRSTEPSVFPEKPNYTIPSFQLPYDINLILIIFIIFVIATGTLTLHLRHLQRNKFRKEKNKILRFSKTIK